MKIKTQPLLGAAAFGIFLLMLYYLVSAVFSYRMVQNLLASGMFDPATLNSPNPPIELADDPIEFMFGISSENFAIFSALAGLATCLVWLGAGVGSGAIYAALHHRQEPLLETPISGGAVAGALAYVIGTLLGSLVSMIAFVPLWQETTRMFTTLSQQSGGMPPGMPAQMITIWGISIVVGLLCSTLFWGGMGAVMGALGSAVGKAIVTR